MFVDLLELLGSPGGFLFPDFRVCALHGVQREYWFHRAPPIGTMFVTSPVPNFGANLRIVSAT